MRAATLFATVALALMLLRPVTALTSQAAPEIAAQMWLNSEPKTLARLKGQVVLVEFWTFGCYNCRNVEPHVKQWDERFGPRGLVVIGVHTPETPAEHDVENVKRYLRDHGITYAVATDNDFATWNRFDNHAWPAWYLIDKKGIVRYTHVGEGAYDQTEQEILQLLAEP